VVKLVIEDVHMLIHLYYIQIGAPLPEDWHGKGQTIWRTTAALEMTANEQRKVETETVIYKSLHHWYCIPHHGYADQQMLW
jgi:hypothetical protein